MSIYKDRVIVPNGRIEELKGAVEKTADDLGGLCGPDDLEIEPAGDGASLVRHIGSCCAVENRHMDGVDRESYEKILSEFALPGSYYAWWDDGDEACDHLAGLGCVKVLCEDGAFVTDRPEIDYDGAVEACAEALLAEARAA